MTNEINRNNCLPRNNINAFGSFRNRVHTPLFCVKANNRSPFLPTASFKGIKMK